MSETMTAPSIPVNALRPEPEYIIKKKFCIATIPAIIAMLTTFFMAGYNIIIGISAGIKFSSINDWSFVEQGIMYGIQFIAVFLLCVLMFAKVNKPFLCAPLVVIGLTYAVHFIFCLIAVYDRNEFEKAFHNLYDIINYNQYTYSDYMTIRICYFVFLAVMIFSFVAAAVYVILASIEKINGKVRKLWFIPVVFSVLSLVMYVVYTVVNIALYCVKTDFDRHGIMVSAIIGALMNLLVYVPEAVTVILLCKWISNPHKKVRKKAPRVPAPVPVMYAPVPQPVPVPPAPAQMPVNAPVPENQAATEQKSNIEQIRQYKELLDMGAITQEEYDEKKKELLTNN